MAILNNVVPTDRFNLAYCFLILHGIGFLLPWNVFINAREYFVDYKLNTTQSFDADYRTNFMSYLGFAAHFPSLCFAAWNTFFQKSSGQSNAVFRFMGAMLIEVTVLLFTIVMTMVDTSECPGIFFVLTIISVVLINCCVGIHQTLTFGMAAVLPMKYSNAVIVGSNACGTIISLVNILTKWLATAQGHSPRSIILASIAYFLSAITIVLACVITFFWLRRLKFVRYYAAVRNKGCIEIYPPENNGTHDVDMDHGENEKSTSIHKGSSTSSTTPDVEFCHPGRNGENSSAVNLEDLNAIDTTTPESTLPAISAEKLETDSLIRATDTPVTNSRTEDPPAGDVQVLRNCFGICCFPRPTGVQRCRAYWSRYVTCFRECWPHCLSVWSVFFCSLSAFPAIQSMVKPVDSNFFISQRWFVDVTCFFFFNLFAMLGCIMCNWIQFPQPKFLWIPVWIRTCFFIPFFLFCNFDLPDPKLPVLIGNDHVYLFGAVVFAFTNGYFSSLGMMYAPRSCAPERAELAGMLAAFFLILGVCSGVYTSRALVSLIL